MRELPIYKVSVHVEGLGSWFRVFAGLPTTTEILSALLEDQSDLTAESQTQWDMYDHWITLVRDFSLPTGEEDKVCKYAGVTIGVIKIKGQWAAIVTEILAL